MRLTGDNPVADADLVDELLAAVEASGHTYGRVDIDRVPEGLGAEVFSVEALRLAADRATASYDREHVTPWLRRELGELLFVPSGPRLDPRRFRCTVDVLADYVRVSGLFTWQTDPVQVPWRTLMAELAGGLGEDAPYLPVRVAGAGQSALVLGLDQLTMPTRGWRAGSCSWRSSTASATSTPGWPAGAARHSSARAANRLWCTGSRPSRGSTPGGHRSARGGRRGADRLERGLERALGDLGRRRCDVVLVQSVDAALADDGAAWQRLCAYRDAGEVNRIGVRVGTREELDIALRLPGLGYLELPATAGGPWWADAVLAAAAASGVVVSLYPADRDGSDLGAALRSSPPWVASALIAPRSELDLVESVRQFTAP